MLKRIKVLREEYGVSQQKLAAGIGVSQQSVNGYENSKIEPDISTLKQMAAYFETSVDYIIEHTHIRRKMEDVEEFALNEREAALMRGYRKIPATSRKIVDELVAEMQKK
jgi:transcriptional regulator with XRE-family HTH domain